MYFGALCTDHLSFWQGLCIVATMFGRLFGSYAVAATSLLLRAGDIVAVVNRPPAEVGAFFQRLPDLWRAACADVGHTCIPRVILDKPDSPEEVTVTIDGGSITLPNIHPWLLLLAQLRPGRQQAGSVGVRLLYGLWLGMVVVVVQHRCLGVGSGAELPCAGEP